MEGGGGDGFEEVGTLRKHGEGVFLPRDGALQFLVHDAVHEQLHELPSVQLLTIARSAAARLVRCEEPLRVRDEQGLRQEALVLDETCLANQGSPRVDAAIGFGVLLPERWISSLDACDFFGCCFGCLSIGFRSRFGLRVGRLEIGF